MKYDFCFKHRTPTQNLSVFLRIAKLDVENISCDKKLFEELCKNGCRNYNKKWCCPPHSPDFTKMPHKKNFFLIILFIYGKDFKAKTESIKMFSIHRILCSYVEKMGALLQSKFGGIYYLAGSCRRCVPCSLPLPCKKGVQYSLESLGVNVDKICRGLGHRLVWYKRGENYEYGTVVGAFETDRTSESREILEVAKGVFLSTQKSMCFNHGIFSGLSPSRVFLLALKES